MSPNQPLTTTQSPMLRGTGSEYRSSGSG